MARYYDYSSVQRGVVYTGKLVRTDVSGKGVRERITCDSFTRSSGKRMAKYLRNSVAEYKVFITLTYPSESACRLDPRQAKRQLRNLIKRIERLVGDADVGQKFSVFWFLEFQKNSSIHFHLFATHYMSKEWLSRAWYEVVGSGLEKHLKSGTKIEKLRSGRAGSISYATKYARKSEQKQAPEGITPGRYWGIEGCRETVAATISVRGEQMTPPFHYEDTRMVHSVIRSALDELQIVKHDYIINGWTVHSYRYDLDNEELRKQILEAYQWMIGHDLMRMTENGREMRFSYDL